MAISLQQIARALNGEIRGHQVAAPGPGHSAADRSLSVKISDSGDDIVVHSFAGDDPIDCKKYVREKCGIQFKPNGRRTSDDIAKFLHEAVQSQRREKPKGKIVATYPYTDANGTLLYEVLRFEPKRFGHRQPDGHGDWIYRGTHKRVIYHWPEIIKYPDATVFVCEGEKDVNNVAALDLCATTVASGKWTDDCVQTLKDRDCWILEDGDDAGRAKSLETAKLLHPLAKSIKIIRLPDLREGGDITDWLDAGHTKDELYDVCSSTPDWEPDSEQQPEQKSEPIAEPEPTKPIPTSKSLVAYPLVAFADVSFTNEIAYLVQGLLPRSGLALVWGPKKCGKSFWIMDLALHVALGWSYRGRKVQQVPVVYLALEGQAGYSRRIKAFKQHHYVREAPFYLLRTEVNLVAKVDEIIKNIAQQLNNEPGFIIIDTMNRSLPGSESSDEDMSKYLNAAAKFVKHFSCDFSARTDRPRSTLKKLECIRRGGRMSDTVIRRAALVLNPSKPIVTLARLARGRRSTAKGWATGRRRPSVDKLKILRSLLQDRLNTLLQVMPELDLLIMRREAEPRRRTGFNEIRVREPGGMPRDARNRRGRPRRTK